MRMRHLLLSSAAAVAFLALLAAPQAQAQNALSGVVSSAEEANMEGVVISAKKEGSTITISVVTDAQGRYTFPASRLGPGKYTIKARAAGYQLSGTPVAEVAAGTEAKADLKLTKLRSLSATLTNAEWLQSMPGTDAQKKFLL